MFPSEPTPDTVLSCDVFDTLLHRDHRSQFRRLRDIAALSSSRLAAERAIARAPGTIWRIRMEVQREAYAAQAMGRPNGDIRFQDVIDATARLLALDKAGGAILHEAELAIERMQLTPHTALFDWLRAQRERTGCRIIAISDTYHTAATISQLLGQLAPNHPIDAVHTSADHDATKRSGALFHAVLRQEGLEPGQMLHIGDDPVSDIAMARAAKLRSWRVVRPRHLRARRKFDALLGRLQAIMHPPGLSEALESKSA